MGGIAGGRALSTPQVTFEPDLGLPAAGRMLVYRLDGDVGEGDAAALGLPAGTWVRARLAVPGPSGVVARELTVEAIPLAGALPALLAAGSDVNIAWRRRADALRVFACLAQVGLDLVATHHLAPTLVSAPDGGAPDGGPPDGRAHGVWRALPPTQARDRMLLDRLAAALPAAGHALLRAERAIWSPDELIAAFLDAVADLCARYSSPHARPGRPRERLLPWTARWVEALGDSDDPRVPLRDDVGELLAAAAAWEGSGKDSDVALTELRLSTPPAGGDHWRLEFGLRLTAGPWVPAADVWETGESSQAADDPAALQEALLRGLGRCARVFAPLDAALRAEAPTGADLALGEAWDFIRHAAPLIEGSGVIVVLPDDLLDEPPELRVRLADVESGPQEDAEATALLDAAWAGDGQAAVHWEVALAGEALSAAELDALLAHGAPLVRWGERWVRVAPDLRERLAGLADGSIGMAEALLLGLAGSAPAGLLPGADPSSTQPVDVVVEGRVADLVARLRETADVPTLEQDPEGFVGELRPYQRRGVAWLGGMADLGLGAVLADDMGLGKCLRGDTPVFVNGAPIRAEDMWERYAGPASPDAEGEWAVPIEPLSVNAIDQEGGGRIVPTLVARLYRQHIDEPLRELLLSDGSRLTATRRHRLLGRDGWTNDLHPGVIVCVPSRLRWRGSPIDARLTRFLAWQIAEGQSGQRSAHKSIPDAVVSADEETLRVFLRAYFSAEAHVSTGQRVIEVASASPWLMDQLSVMLRRFGVWLRTSVKHKAATNGSGKRRPYVVGLIGGSSLRSFQEFVGFEDQRKQAALETVAAARCNGNVEGVPIRDVLTTMGARAEQPKRQLGAQTVATLDPPRQEVHYVRVVDVREVHHRGWVYDLEVPEGSNFVAGGALCHNTIQLIGHVLERGKVGPHLVVCPTSVVGNWERELRRFAPDVPVTRFHGPERAEKLEGVEGVVVTSYGVIRRDADPLVAVDWDVVALDEAQHVKNPATAGAKAVRLLRAEQVVALTGTPLENRLAELWSLLDVTNRGLLGSRARFGRRYVAPIERRRDPGAAARLRRVVAPFVLRREKRDPDVASELPAKIERTVACSLTPEQARLYEQAVGRVLGGEGLAGASAMQRRGRVLALLTALKQICNHPAHYLREAEGRDPDASSLPGRSGKLAAAREIIAEATGAGEQVLVFTQFVEMGRLLVAQFGSDLDADVPFLHGGVAAAARDAMVAAFQGESASDVPPAFVVSLRAGGLGLNLTAATHVLHYDRWWNPAVEDQATDRTHRIGQQRTVEVHKLVTAGTVEERVADLLERKRALASTIVGPGEQWITELGETDLRELVALSAAGEDLDDDDDFDEDWDRDGFPDEAVEA